MPSRHHGQPETEPHTASPQPLCPNCHQPLPDEAGEAWVPIARLANLAEAGFMANLLADQHVPSRIRQVDDFSAVDGTWASIFILQVPDQDAQQAAERIRAELAKSPPDAPHQDAATREAGLADATVIAWRPVAWVLVAGSLAYLAGYGVPGRRDRPGPPAARQTLWDEVSRIGIPLISQSPPGRPQFRLSFDAATDQFQLDEDHDGDGQFELRRRYHRQAVGPSR